MASGQPPNWRIYRLSQWEIDNFFKAATDGDKKNVAEFLKIYPTAIDERDSVGRTALMWAARYGRWEITELLLEKGAALEAKDNGGRTPLIFAAENGNEITVEFLLEKGARLEAKDNAGCTAQMYAERRNRAKMVDLLKNWPEIQRQRLLEKKKEQEINESNFSKGLIQAIPARPPLKLPRHKGPGA